MWWGGGHVMEHLLLDLHVHRTSVNTHRLKCSMIFSSRTFSGKFPTHKCRVSRTIVCIPGPRSYTWVCSVNYLRGEITYLQNKRNRILRPSWPSATIRLDPRTLFDTQHWESAIWHVVNALFTVPVTRRVPDSVRPLVVKRLLVAAWKDAAILFVMRSTPRTRGIVWEPFATELLGLFAHARCSR